MDIGWYIPFEPSYIFSIYPYKASGKHRTTDHVMTARYGKPKVSRRLAELKSNDGDRGSHEVVISKST